DSDQQLRGAGKHARDAIAGLYATGLQEVGEARGSGLELGEGPGSALTVAALPDQRDPPRLGVAVTAFDTGIEGIEPTGQGGGSGGGVIELAGSGEVIAHRGTPRLFLLEYRDGRAGGRWRQCRKVSTWMS